MNYITGTYTHKSTLSSQMRPLFSIITITFNAESTLPPTLESIAAQTCKLYEHIIIDGASSDDTVRLAQEAAIPNSRIVSEPDRGLYDAMNKGLGLATGDYVIFLNAGDSFHSPDTLRKVADKIIENDYPGIVYGQTDIVDKDRVKISDRHLIAPEELTLESFGQGMVVCHQAFFALRKLTSNYVTGLKYSADYEWCIRVLQRSHRNVYIGETVADYLSGGLTLTHHFESLVERFRIMSHYYGLFHTLRLHISRAFKNLSKRKDLLSES